MGFVSSMNIIARGNLVIRASLEAFQKMHFFLMRAETSVYKIHTPKCRDTVLGFAQVQSKGSAGKGGFI